MHDNVLNNDVGHWQLEKDKMLGQLGENKIIVYCNHEEFRFCLVAVCDLYKLHDLYIHDLYQII